MFTLKENEMNMKIITRNVETLHRCKHMSRMNG